MTIRPGERLGPYEVVAAIGAGGMGEVWRARDTQLGREVALKILPPQFAGDGGMAPVWAPNGLTLFYRDSTAKRVSAVPVSWTDRRQSLASQP